MLFLFRLLIYTRQGSCRNEVCCWRYKLWWEMRADPRYRSVFTSENINGVLIPSTLVVAGTFLFKPEWVPYVVAVTAVLAGLKFMSGGSSTSFFGWEGRKIYLGN